MNGAGNVLISLIIGQSEGRSRRYVLEDRRKAHIIALGDLLGPAVYSYVGFRPVVAIGLPQECGKYVVSDHCNQVA
jgi:hypothetical protein